MNHVVKRMWVEALRSGDYPQGSTTLRTSDNSYCCLGVLCALAANHGIVSWLRQEDDGQWWVGDVSQGPFEGAVLPEQVIRWAGLEDCNPVLDGRSCMTRNDHDKQPFAEIADLIEEHL